MNRVDIRMTNLQRLLLFRFLFLVCDAFSASLSQLRNPSGERRLAQSLSELGRDIEQEYDRLRRDIYGTG